MNGIVKRLVPDRGFGFIKADDGQEYFFHRSGVKGSTRFEQLREGQEVTLSTATGEKGPRAENVTAV